MGQRLGAIMDYDPTTCITAGELRSQGNGVPANIPDCAWIPKNAVHVAYALPTSDAESGILQLGGTVTYSAQFQFFKVEMPRNTQGFIIQG